MDTRSLSISRSSDYTRPVRPDTIRRYFGVALMLVAACAAPALAGEGGSKKPSGASQISPDSIAAALRSQLGSTNSEAKAEENADDADNDRAERSDEPRRSPPMVRANESTISPSADSEGTEDESGDQYINVGVDDRVTMHVSGLPLADAIRMLSEPTKRNIILGPNVNGTVGATLYDVTFDEALNAMLISNGLGYRTSGNFIYVHPIEDIEKMEQATRKLETRIFRLSYTRANVVKGLIDKLSSEAGMITTTPDAKVGLGGEVGLPDTEGDNNATNEILIITDYPDVIEKMARIIKDVDSRPRQVLIEATILRATLNDNNALGIDFKTVGGIDFTTLGSTSPAAQTLTTGTTPPNLLGDTTLTARTDFNANVPTGGFTFGIIKDQISLFIRALEEVTDTDVIANPKVLALNKQYGQVIVGRRDGYITTTITETTAVQTVEFLETGTILAFRPFVGEDGYVRMEIHPKDSTGGLTAANLPFEQTTEVTTNIMVKDGHTILIGGLFREVTTAIRSQMPLFGDLPGLGALFRSTNDATVREEVIILLTVRIVKDQYDYAKGEELYEDVERVRVLSRQGLQPFGRERMSEHFYAKAVEHYELGDVSKAEWYARLSLNSYSRNTLALKLLEEIEGRREWESEASTIRSVIQDLGREEQGLPRKPQFGRPAPPFDLPNNTVPLHETPIEKSHSKSLKGPSGLEPMREVSP